MYTAYTVKRVTEIAYTRFLTRYIDERMATCHVLTGQLDIMRKQLRILPRNAADNELCAETR